MYKLIIVFARHTGLIVCFVVRWLICHLDRIKDKVSREENKLKAIISFPTDRSKAAALLQFFLVYASVISYVVQSTLVISKSKRLSEFISRYP